MERIHSRPALTHIKTSASLHRHPRPQLIQTHPLFLGLTSVWLTGLTLPALFSYPPFPLCPEILLPFVVMH